MQQIIDLVSGRATFSLPALTLFSVSILLLLMLVFLLEYQTRPRFLKKAMQQYKDYAFDKITKKNISSFLAENTSTYLSALTNDVTSIEANYLSKIFTLVSEILMFIGSFVLMLYYSPLLTLFAFLFSIIPVFGSVLTGNRLALQEKKVSDQNESFLGMVKDSLSGFSTMKCFKAEAQILKSFISSNHKTEDLKSDRQKTDILIQAIGAVASVIAQFGVFLIGADLAIHGHGVTAGVVIIFVQLMNFVLAPISSIPQFIANRKAAHALIQKLAGLIEGNVRRDGIAVAPSLSDGIQLKDLSFGYEKGSTVLHNLNFNFEAGKSYALVGGSGSGKSTLLNLLMGSFENYQGEITLDQNELRSIDSDSLYDLISIVQQKAFIFNSSIQDNITMFRNFDEKKVERAMQCSGISELMKERGSDYLCGENGCGLSGGEQQRISIARCLLHETPVLLVDEATASLDAATAFSVGSSLLDLTGITRIIVTHRLEEALMKRYDAVVILKNGSICETGSFHELMEKKGYFYSLFTVSQ